MPYLIDGNNLMSNRQTRRELLEEVADFAAAKKVRVTVVFDGAPENSFPDGSSFKQVKIYYNKYGYTADDRIKQMVESSKERQTLFVVTDDRALANFVRKTACKVLTCREFKQRIAALKTSENEQTRLQGVEADEIKDWMRYFGVDETDE
jgi:predicted RNA-binding protein with PIN domain